jgi:hypothetical protein
MKSLKSDTGVFPREEPVDGGFGVVLTLLPGSYLPPDRFHIRKAPLQALSFEHRQFDLSDIKPAGVFRCVAPFKTLGDAASFGRWKPFEETGSMMNIQIVHDRHDSSDTGVDHVNQVTLDLGTVWLGAPLSDPNLTEPYQWFHGKKEGTVTMPRILISYSVRLSGRPRQLSSGR